MMLPFPMLVLTITAFLLNVGKMMADDLTTAKFPTGFAFGVTSSSFPTEGAWDEDGKGRSIWDTFTEDANHFQGEGNAKVAADAYHKVKEDVQLLKHLGISHYRFSISWPRILPDGTKAHVNQKGVNYYNTLIDELKANNIQPFVTLHHWDFPQALQDRGGWSNDASIGWFSDYADICFRNFGNRIKIWTTINDPFSIAYKGYETGEHAPGKKQPELLYKVAHNLIRSHVAVYHLYKDKYKFSQHGQVGITLRSDWYIAADHGSIVQNREAAERARQFQLGWFANPLFEGEYPQVMKEKIAVKSLAQGLQASKLPVFTSVEKIKTKGATDFIGINHYKSKIVSEKAKANRNGFYNDQDIEMTVDHSYPKLEYRPELNFDSDRRLMGFGLKELLLWMKKSYHNPNVFVTENGLDSCGTMRDQNRISYIREYSNNVLKAIHAGANVKGYFVSTFLDGFNWDAGYVQRTGLYFVDFDNDERPRYHRDSATFYKKLIASRGLTTQLRSYRAYAKDRDEFHYGKFPNDFMWGTASSAYQIEGGWNADGKGPSIWDTWAHAGKIASKMTGDVSSDSYHLYMEDVANLKRLCVQFYRFSISWSCILPDGTASSLNTAGIEYYNKLINALIKENITPMITLYHWDLPQALQDHDGWRNDSIIPIFADYAKICFQHFGNRVKYWLTFNEPFAFAWQGYGYGGVAPGIWDAGWGVYKVVHNIIRSHSKAYHIYKTQFKDRYKGNIGITLDIEWKEGLTDAHEDTDAAERAIEFKLGWFANPIYGNGDYPDIMKTKVAEKSKTQGHSFSRLPVFTEEEKKLNRGSFDFLGMNHYTSTLISDKPWPTSWENYELDQDLKEHHDLCWWPNNDWNRFNPSGFRYILRWVKNKYNNPPVFITENGFGTQKTLEDNKRITYHTYYINELLKVSIDGVNVKGYALWSLMDSCEWNAGYWAKFGLHQVDFDDPKRKRTPRKSASWYKNLIQTNGFDRA